jgi:hypothetical protein
LASRGIKPFFNTEDQHSLACFLSQVLWKRRLMLAQH